MSDDLSKVGCASERRPTAYEHANGAYDPDCAACREYAEPSPSDDIAKRMEALVRGMAKANGVLSHSSDYTEARAIVEGQIAADTKALLAGTLPPGRTIEVRQATRWVRDRAAKGASS